jgi:hypothetical protein
MSAPNYRYAECCATCEHYEQDYDAWGECDRHEEECGCQLRGGFHQVCDDYAVAPRYEVSG